MDYDGERLGCAMEDSAGALTFNVGTVNMDENGRIFLQCNIRYPASVEYNDIRELLERQLKKYGFFYNEVDYLAPVYHKKGLSTDPVSDGGLSGSDRGYGYRANGYWRSYLCKGTS